MNGRDGFVVERLEVVVAEREPFAQAHDRIVARGFVPVFLDVETKRMHGHYIGDPQVYRSKEDRDDAAEHDPIPRLRDRLELSEEEFAAFDEHAHEIVDKALEFAQNGTDPQPEDALKNVYA